MGINFNLNLWCNIFEYLPLQSVLKMALINTKINDFVSRFVVFRRIPAAVVRKLAPKRLHELTQRYKIIKNILNRKIIAFPVLKNANEAKSLQINRINLDFSFGTIIEDCKVIGNYFFVKIHPQTGYYCYLKNVIKKHSTAKILINDHFCTIENIFKIDTHSNNLIYLTKDQKMKMRLNGNYELSSDEELISFHPNLDIFKETQYEIKNFFSSENVLTFITTNLSIFLIDSSNGISSAGWKSQCYLIFKVEIDHEVRSICPSNNSIIFLSKNLKHIFDFSTTKNVLQDRILKFCQEENPLFLTLNPTLTELSDSREINRVCCLKNLFLLEIRTKPIDFKDFSKQEIIELFHKIDMTDFDKIIIYNNISGYELLNFSEKNIEDMFGLRSNSHSKFKLMDEIAIRKNIRFLPPNLYLYGSNHNTLFEKSQHLHSYTEISIPNFDINEEILLVDISLHNIVLKTNKNRCFISIKSDTNEEKKRKKDSLQNNIDEVEIKGNTNKSKNVKQKWTKGDKPKKDNVKISKVVQKEKTEWFCLEDLVLTADNQFSESDCFHKIHTNGSYFYGIVGECLDDRFGFYQSAAEFFNFLKFNKVFASDDILFCAESMNKYYIYEEILARPNLLKDIRIIKRKNDHFVLWSKYNPYFDSRSNVL